MLDTVPDIIQQLHKLSKPSKVIEREKKFGITTHGALGLTQSEINDLVKIIPKETSIAMKLFETDIYEAKILCGKLFPPRKLDLTTAKRFAGSFDNWEICDTFSLKLFCRSTIAILLINIWHSHENEFIKRAAFATIAGLCMADKKSDNSVFSPFFELIELHSTDPRLYVKKGVNWALRGLGKRNQDLKSQAIRCANNILERDNAAAQWIAKDALKELQSANCRMADYPRSIYRKLG